MNITEWLLSWHTCHFRIYSTTCHFRIYSTTCHFRIFSTTCHFRAKFRIYHFSNERVSPKSLIHVYHFLDKNSELLLDQFSFTVINHHPRERVRCIWNYLFCRTKIEFKLRNNSSQHQKPAKLKIKMQNRPS